MKTEVTGRRFKFVDVPYTESERRVLKTERIREALEWEPPLSHSTMEEIPKDHSDYEKSFLAETITWVNIPQSKEKP